MAIKKISIENFKSFEQMEVELGQFNVLIGANASGKSNFISIFQLLKDIVNHGLSNAISLQGGVEYFRNMNLGPQRNFSLRITSDQPFDFDLALLGRDKHEQLLSINATEASYEFEIKFRKSNSDFDIIKDELRLTCDLVEENTQHPKQMRKLGPGELCITNINGNVNSKLHSPQSASIEKNYEPWLFPTTKLPAKTLLLERGYAFPFFFTGLNFIDGIGIYDFDPKQLKKAIPMAGKRELAGDGSNLAIVLKNIAEDKEKKRKFSNLVRDLLPFIEDFHVARFADKALILELQEIYSRGNYLPASFMSDGTVNMVALIIALYFEEKPIVIVEEPERNIHPFLISKVVAMLKEVSSKKQIIVTTQNPEIVKYVELEDILLVSRNKEGFSTLSRPAEKERVQAFLENEIGVEELYVRNLLGA